MDMHPHRVILALRSATISDGLTGHLLMRAEAARTDFRGVPSMRRILFVDDHPIYRDGVRRVLESSGPDVRVLTADGASSALKLLAQATDIDLCLTDQRLLDGEGAGLARVIRELYPSVAVGLLCSEPTLTLANEMRAIGAVACLSKDRDTAALCEAIDRLYSGDTIFDDFVRGGAAQQTLSLRRREILVFAGQGLLDKQISDKLGITESTVRNHWQHIFTQLDVGNRTEAVTKALRQGLI
jgi:DNA-binding NarL/FixJ family response regulator